MAVVGLAPPIMIAALTEDVGLVVAITGSVFGALIQVGGIGTTKLASE